MALETLFSLFRGIIPFLAKYILLPVYFTLGLYIAVFLLARKKGITLKEDFNRKFFMVLLFIMFGASAFFLLPAEMMLPLGGLSLRNVLGLFIVAVLFQFLIYVGAVFLEKQSTTLSLGFTSGLRRSTLAASVLAPMAAKDRSFKWNAATSIMLANTVAVARNFLVIFFLGVFLGFFTLPPFHFAASMGVMFLVSAVSTAIFYRKSSGSKKIEYQSISFKGTTLFISFFLVMYYIAREILAAGLFLIFYILAAVLGFLYGAAHILIITALFFTQNLGPEAGVLGAFLVTAGSLISDIPYSFLAGSDELTKILAVSEVLALLSGVIVLLYYI